MPDLVGHDTGSRHDNDVTLGSDRGSHVRREMPDLVGHDARGRHDARVNMTGSSPPTPTGGLGRA